MDNEQPKNKLTIPNQTQYKLDCDIPNKENDEKYCNKIAERSYDRHANQEALIEVIHDKEHCINELKSRHYHDIQAMNKTMHSKNKHFEELTQEWQKKLDEMQQREELYDEAVSKFDNMKQQITQTNNANDNLLQSVNSKDEQIKKYNFTIHQLQNKIINQQHSKTNIAQRTKLKRPQSAINQYENVRYYPNVSNIEQKMFKEVQNKLNQCNNHKELILMFLREIINITYEQNTDNDDNKDNFNCGEFWFSEAITLMKSYPDLFEKHLESLKQKIKNNLSNLNQKVIKLNEKIHRQNKDKERRTKIIKKLKFEVKQNQNMSNMDGSSDPLLNIKDQQILSNMELIETFFSSQINYFESVVKNANESISSHKTYLLKELKEQCTEIDVKWHKLLSSICEQTNGDDTGDITQVIKHGLDKLDDIKSRLKIYIKAMDDILEELKTCTAYLYELMSSIMDEDVAESECFDVQLFGSTKMSLIIQTIAKCNEYHIGLNEAIAKYEKHSFCLQKHLYEINSLLSDSINRNYTSQSDDFMNVNEKVPAENDLYHQIRSMVKERMSQSPQKEIGSLNQQKPNDPMSELLIKSNEIRSKSKQIQESSTKQPLQKPSTLPKITKASPSPFIVDDATENEDEPDLISNASSQYEPQSMSVQRHTEQQSLSSHHIPSNSFDDMNLSNMTIPSNFRKQIVSKKKQQKKLGKSLRQKTMLLEKCSAQIAGLERQRQLILSKRKILKKRKMNEIKKINQQISNIIVRPNNNEAAIQEQKRLGIKIITKNIIKRDPKKQEMISKTMIQQMVQRKIRVKKNYSKQIKELENDKNIRVTIKKIEKKRNGISEQIRSMIDTFAIAQNEIKEMVQVSKTQRQSVKAAVNNDRLMNMKRMLPPSMIQKYLQNNGKEEFEEHNDLLLKNIMYGNENNDRSSLTLPQIGGKPVQLATNNELASTNGYF